MDNSKHIWYNNAIYFKQKLYSDYKDEIKTIRSEFPFLTETPPSKTEILSDLFLANMGKMNFMSSFLDRGFIYSDYEKEKVSHSAFIDCVFWINERLREHGLDDPFLAYKETYVSGYDKSRHEHTFERIRNFYIVSEKDKESLKERKFIRFLWRPQVFLSDLDKIIDYPY